jgi:hypothetical protein
MRRAQPPPKATIPPAQELAAEIMAASRPGEPMTKHQFDAGAMIKDVVRQMKAGNCNAVGTRPSFA